jgi:hypothetical protein
MMKTMQANVPEWAKVLAYSGGAREIGDPAHMVGEFLHTF